MPRPVGIELRIMNSERLRSDVAKTFLRHCLVFCLDGLHENEEPDRVVETQK
jgi:hypothetical protein